MRRQVGGCHSLRTAPVDAVSSDSSPDQAKTLPKYDMQCVDCHNRASHSFEMRDRAMDKALALGDIAVTLPFIKKKSVEFLLLAVLDLVLRFAGAQALQGGRSRT